VNDAFAGPADENLEMVYKFNVSIFKMDIQRLNPREGESHVPLEARW